MKILFLVPYPLKESPSQRFRFEQYLQILLAAGHSYEVRSFLDSQRWKAFFKKGKWVSKVSAIVHGVSRRFFVLLQVRRFDRVFIHREGMPIGPPILEWIIVKILKKKIIYDFDDAIWLSDRAREPGWLKLIKWRKKVQYICQWSYKVSCGNDYLCEYAAQFNQAVVYNPSTIDTQHFHNPELYTRKQNVHEIVIGWTGSHSTLKYIEGLEDVLKQIEEKYPQVKFLIITDQPPALSLKSLRFVQWSPQNEVEELLKMDIGIMPLSDDAWSKGKCGLKALQYMSLGIPALVSPVGVNTRIVDHGVNGYHCVTAGDWRKHIEYLIPRKEVCEAMGKNGRQKVINHYSVLSNTTVFLSLFE